MEKPKLVVESTPDDSFISIRCSSCANFKVRIEGNTLKNKALMRGMYDLHFRQVHLGEDASQAAARIAREATEGK